MCTTDDSRRITDVLGNSIDALCFITDSLKTIDVKPIDHSDGLYLLLLNVQHELEHCYAQYRQLENAV